MRRAKIVSTIVKIYKTHPAVEKAIINQRKHDSSGHRGKSDEIAYLNEIGSYEMLDDEQVPELFSYIEQGVSTYETTDDFTHLSNEQTEAFIKLTAAHQVIFLANLRLVFSTVKSRFNRTPLSAMDLINAGNEELHKAISAFDVSRGLKFSTLAVKCIKDGIGETIARESRSIRLPYNPHQEHWEATQKINTRVHKLGRELTDDEIEEVTGMSIKEFSQLKRDAEYELPSLNYRTGTDDNDGTELGDLIPEPESSMDNMIEALSDHMSLKDIFQRANLDDREKFIIGLRFNIPVELLGPIVLDTENGRIAYEEAASIAPGRGLILKEVGHLVGLTRERIRQIQADALNRLRKAAAGMPLPPRNDLMSRLKMRHQLHPGEDKPSNNRALVSSAEKVVSPLDIARRIKPKAATPVKGSLIDLEQSWDIYHSSSRVPTEPPEQTEPETSLEHEPIEPTTEQKMRRAGIRPVGRPLARLKKGGDSKRYQGRNQGPKITWEDQVREMEQVTEKNDPTA